MDNVTIARALDETAALLEIDSADPFRVRSYRRAAEAVEQQTTSLAALVGSDPKALLAIPGIGKGMAANITQLVEAGEIPLRGELLKKYRPSMLELLRLPGMGPKTVALVWSALGVSDIDSLEAAAKEGKLADLPRKLHTCRAGSDNDEGPGRGDRALRDWSRWHELHVRLPPGGRLFCY